MTDYEPTGHPLIAALLGRERSLLADDLTAAGDDLTRTVAGTRLLVVGAAGSIGRAFVRRVIPLRPRALHLVDLSENGLVELVRDLRAGDLTPPDDFRTFAVGLGESGFRRLLAAHGPYDRLINFAALKHVRSERDPFSLMRMVETNAGAMYDLLAQGELDGGAIGFARAFTVSTDKASHPTSAMGASKRLMELIHLAHAGWLPFSSARFANVAFSDGSLLDGWRHRLTKRQPLAAPSDIRRYFFSHQEAGELCLLACFLGDNREILFPRLDPSADLMPLRAVAETFLRHHGFEPLPCADAEEARTRAADLAAGSRRWPCLFEPSATSGEKPAEAFFGPEDDVDLTRFARVGAIRQPVAVARGPIEHAMTTLRAIGALPEWRKPDIIAALRIAVPEFAHAETGRDLDQRM